MNKIRVEQMMYGYHNGHTLLASSLGKKISGQRITDILSDASGNGFFQPYITGYPLQRDGYYAFSKTWYAEEMPRPGCVWTHILLFPFDFVASESAEKAWSSLFFRPSDLKDFSEYTETMTISDEIEEISEDGNGGYPYMVYTLFSTDQHIYVCDADGEKYENALMDIVLKSPMEFRENMTVCSGTKSNRFFHDDVFAFQIAKERVVKQICKSVKDSVVYKGVSEDIELPTWARYLSGLLYYGEQEKLFDLGMFYHETMRAGIKELAKVLFATDSFKKREEFDIFLSYFDRISGGAYYKDRTIEGVFFEEQSYMDDKFTMKSIIDYLVDSILGHTLSSKINDKKIPIKKRRIFGEEIYQNPNNVRKIIYSYMKDELDENGAELSEEIIGRIEVNDLKEIFNLDRNVCKVLIGKRPHLAICKDLWKQSEDFQKEMLDTAAEADVGGKVAIELAEVIVANSNGHIAEFAVEKMGESICGVVISEIEKYIENGGGGKAEDDLLFTEWMPVLVGKREYFEKLLQLDLDWNVTHNLMRQIDPFKNFNDAELGVFTELLQKYERQIENADLVEDAIFSLFFVIRDMDAFSGDFKNWVFDRLNVKLERNEMPYEEWSKMEKVLPSVEIERSWDKCLRLRMAFGRE